uniref:hypothetical protein n=1 Tax=Mangrovicoccus sp. HB161399 TaxID=2720392 RepID=UPI0020A6D086
CLIPRFDGVILSKEWKDALWDKFVTEAPRSSDRKANVRIRREGRTPSEQQYSDRKLRPRR